MTETVRIKKGINADWICALCSNEQRTENRNVCLVCGSHRMVVRSVLVKLLGKNWRDICFGEGERMKGKRVREKQSGRTGVVTRRTGNCLWVKMDDDGTERSGAKQYFKVIPMRKKE